MRWGADVGKQCTDDREWFGQVFESLVVRDLRVLSGDPMCLGVICGVAGDVHAATTATCVIPASVTGP